MAITDASSGKPTVELFDQLQATPFLPGSVTEVLKDFLVMVMGRGTRRIVIEPEPAIDDFSAPGNISPRSLLSAMAFSRSL